MKNTSKGIALMLACSMAAASLAGCALPNPFSAASSSSSASSSSKISVSSSQAPSSSASEKDGTLEKSYEFYSDTETANAVSSTASSSASSESGSTDAYNYNLPEQIEVNGHIYKLSTTDTQYVSEGTRKVVQKVIDMNGLTQAGVDGIAGEGDFDVNGTTYHLKNEQQYLTDGVAHYEITSQDTFEDQTGKPVVPDTKAMTYYSDVLQKNLDVTGKLTSLEATGDAKWTDNLVITTKFVASDPNATEYTLNGTTYTVPYNAAAPSWTGYQTDILKACGLSSQFYKITGCKWTSDFKVENGQYVRYGQFTGSKKTATYVATYTASGETAGYNAKVYYRADAASVNAKDADTTTVYKIRAVAHYVLVK